MKKLMLALSVLVAMCAGPVSESAVAVRLIPSLQAGVVSYEISYNPPSVIAGQAPVVSYRTYILRGDPAVSADTIVLGNTTALKDTLSFAHGDSVNSNLRAAARSFDTRGRASGISTTPPFVFDPFPLPPSPPTAITTRKL